MAADRKPHQKTAHEFIQRKRDTPQVKAACHIVQEYLQAANIHNTRAAEWMRYQVLCGLTPLKVLEATLALYLLHRDRPALVTSGPRLKLEMGKGIVQMYPLSSYRNDKGEIVGTRQTTGRVRLEVGEWAIAALWAFWANCESAICSVEERHARDRRLIRADFAV